MGVNNLRSVVGSLRYLGYDSIVIKNRSNNEFFSNNTAWCWSFPVGMKNLKKNGLDVIPKLLQTRKTYIGNLPRISNALSSSTEFGNTKGLNILNGKVKISKV